MTQNEDPAAVQLDSLEFSWNPDQEPTLKIDHFEVQKGEKVFIEGASGTGKSTLLNLLAGVIVPQKGSVDINGVRLSGLSGPQRDRFRADSLGYIYQMFNLIPYLSMVDNVLLPCRFSHDRRKKAGSSLNDVCRKKARHLLEKLGMADPRLMNAAVTDLSVGQQQRVAAARALIGSPELIIADEPTSALDVDHREAFIQLLFQECIPQKTTLVFVSHDRGLAPLFDRKIRLDDINTVKHK